MNHKFLIAISGLMIASASVSANAADSNICAADNTAVTVPYTVTCRPAENQRLFKSKAVEKEIKRVKKMLNNAKLAWMFENCFPNTIDTTVHYRKDAEGKNETFVYTGDIHAMWLRDSGAQVWPYVSLANQDSHLKDMIEGVIRQQFKLINIDPYANAFNDGPT
ncbi:MAG: glycoside hydrolase family 125 protein, partial [Muribaculaceae bacterium]|nr:glycoside hydrolase family 125 protein [Muribaculaceae bacterium]